MFFSPTTTPLTPPPFFCLVFFYKWKLKIECSVKAMRGRQGATSFSAVCISSPRSSSLRLSPSLPPPPPAFILLLQVVNVMKKVLQVREGLHSVATLNFNVAHGHVCSKSCQYLIQQLERLWGATESVYYTRIAVVFIYFLLCRLLVIFYIFNRWLSVSLLR